MAHGLKEHDIWTKERTAIELRCLTRAIYLPGVYDQVNGPSLACIEELCRRVSQLIEAYSSGDGTRPNWALRAYALPKSKEQVELENLRARAAGVVPVQVTDNLQAALPRAPAKVTAAAKAKAKAKIQRQLTAAGAVDP